jgi:hypothetical protein
MLTYILEYRVLILGVCEKLCEFYGEMIKANQTSPFTVDQNKIQLKNVKKRS